MGRANQESVLQTFYDMHPYPSYPFAARPRFQEGIWANPRFHLHRAGLKAGSRPLKVLIGGAGAILPAVIGSWLCPNDVLIVNDLSARSLRRAKFAMRWRHLFQNRWFVEPLQATLQRFPHNFLDHADLFGVLHHMSHPEDVLVPLFDCLKPGATVRVMVYHHHGRELVRRVRDRVAPFSPFEPRDIMKARARVRALADDKDWQSFFAAIGPAWKVSDADFVDRFMHPLERYFSIVQWQQIFREVGFHLTAVMDRYAELDDLVNPLYAPPHGEQLDKYAALQRFHGNYECTLTKPMSSDEEGSVAPVENYRAGDLLYIASLKVHTPPRIWFEFPETASLSCSVRWRIWWQHLAQVFMGLPRSDLPPLAQSATDRLLRLGAITV